MMNDEVRKQWASLCDKYADVLGDDTGTTDLNLLRLVSGLDALSTGSEPSISLVNSIRGALDEQISGSFIQRSTSYSQPAFSTALSLLAHSTQWIMQTFSRVPKVALGLLVVFVLIGAAYSAMSVIDQALYLNDSTRQIAEQKLGVELNQSKTIDGFTVSVKRAYAHEDQIVIGYTISGPYGRKFDSFLASGAFNKTPDNTPDILPTLTDAQGNRLNVIGVAAASDSGAQNGEYEYGQALRYDTPAMADSAKAVSLHFTVGRIIAYERMSEDSLQTLMVTGPFEFDFTVPIESCCMKTQPK